MLSKMNLYVIFDVLCYVYPTPTTLPLPTLICGGCVLPEAVDLLYKPPLSTPSPHTQGITPLTPYHAAASHTNFY
jgi:hypothetical protein